MSGLRYALLVPTDGGGLIKGRNAAGERPAPGDFLVIIDGAGGLQQRLESNESNSNIQSDIPIGPGKRISSAKARKIFSRWLLSHGFLNAYDLFCTYRWSWIPNCVTSSHSVTSSHCHVITHRVTSSHTVTPSHTLSYHTTPTYRWSRLDTEIMLAIFSKMSTELVGASARQVQVFLDRHRLQDGQNFSTEFSTALMSSSGAFPILSAAALERFLTLTVSTIQEAFALFYVLVGLFCFCSWSLLTQEAFALVYVLVWSLQPYGKAPCAFVLIPLCDDVTLYMMM